MEDGDEDGLMEDDGGYGLGAMEEGEEEEEENGNDEDI